MPNIVSVSFDRPGLLTVGSSREVRPNLKSGFSNNPTSGTTAGCTGVTAGQKLGDPARWFDPCAFSLQPAGYFGNLGRNTMILPGSVNFDFSLVKNNRWGEGKNVQFRAEFFNIFNHPNFSAPVVNVFASATGVPSATAGRITSTAGDNRRIQFGLKITF